MKLIRWIGKWIFSLRYRVEVRGLELLPKENRGTLLLLNHPSLLDGIIFEGYISSLYNNPVFIMNESMARLKAVKMLPSSIKKVMIPNVKPNMNPYKIKKIQQALQEISTELKRGENFVMAPAGQTKNSEQEFIGGASLAHSLIQRVPDANIALLRLTGLWGSSFSRALTGHTADLAGAVLNGVKVLMKNLLFFAPRRKILVEIEMNPPDLPRGAPLLELNRYLENWYNRREDSLSLVSYTFWKKSIPEVASSQKTIAIPDEVREKIYAELRRLSSSPSLNISPEMFLSTDLGLDSLNISDLAAFISKNFGSEELDFENMRTVYDALYIAVEKPSIKAPVQKEWPLEPDRPIRALRVGDTIPEAFLHRCRQMGSYAACRDDALGILTYDQLKRAAFVLAEYFKTLPDRHVAILLPASTGALITFLALQFAGKVPVMLNWTLGSRFLEEMAKTSEVNQVITSWKFLDRAPNIDLGDLTNKILCLEDIRENLTLKMKLKGALLASLPVKIKSDPHAVILFTSGSEFVPKAVPLMHRHVLASIDAQFELPKYAETHDALLAMLPFFHVSGLIVTTLSMLLCGIKLGFYPNPNNSHAIANRIEKWKITTLMSPQSFIKNLLSVATKEQMSPVRFFFTGGEKAPPELSGQVSALGPNAQLIEGYGSTETSGSVSSNHPFATKRGVGKLLPNVELCTIHPETLELLSPETEGEICLNGPSIFNGYLGGIHPPFIEIEGKKWYRTGDLGRLDKDGYLTVSGRIKRFIKLGGEMISLGAVEEILTKELISRGIISIDSISLAICAEEKEIGQPKLILFTPIELNTELSNAILKKNGCSNLIKISAVRKIEEIPIMGTGKINYAKLKTL